MGVITAGSIRQIVQQVNDLGIKKEQIVTILKDLDQYILVYYYFNN